MKTDKEYPATHSMETAWYCVDEDGNVGIFQIDDNGPVPEGYDYGDYPDGLFWYGLSLSNEGMIYDLPLSKEQIEPMLIPKENPEGEWDNCYGREYNYWWTSVIIKIDMTKLSLLEQALALKPDQRGYDGEKAICISRTEGLFYVNFDANKKGVNLLKENNVIKAVYSTPDILLREPYDDDDEENEEYKLYPVFVYWQNYWPSAYPASKYSEPKYPLKLSQLPKEIQTNALKLPIRFKDTENIQLAEYMPVKVSGCPEYVYDNKLWALLRLSDDSEGYYCQKTHTLIRDKEFKKYLDEGLAEEFDWDKHRNLDFE